MQQFDKQTQVLDSDQTQRQILKIDKNYIYFHHDFRVNLVLLFNNQGNSKAASLLSIERKNFLELSDDKPANVSMTLYSD